MFRWIGKIRFEIDFLLTTISHFFFLLHLHFLLLLHSVSYSFPSYRVVDWWRGVFAWNFYYRYRIWKLIREIACRISTNPQKFIVSFALTLRLFSQLTQKLFDEWGFSSCWNGLGVVVLFACNCWFRWSGELWKTAILLFNFQVYWRPTMMEIAKTLEINGSNPKEIKSGISKND